MSTQSETTAIVNVFTREHKSISDNFTDRIISMLRSEEKQLKTYGLTEKYGQEMETVEFELGHLISLEVKLVKRK